MRNDEPMVEAIAMLLAIPDTAVTVCGHCGNVVESGGRRTSPTRLCDTCWAAALAIQLRKAEGR